MTPPRLRRCEKEVLFISHDASRTGAPLLLLYLLRWLRSNTDIPFSVVLRGRGELLSEFRRVARVFVIDEGFLRNSARLAAALLRRVGLAGLAGRLPELLLSVSLLPFAKWTYRRNHVGLIYSNTLVNGDLLQLLSGLQCPVITHAHELETSMRHFAPGKRFAPTLQLTTHFIAASCAVRSYLAQGCGIPDGRIEVAHSFIDAQEWIHAKVDSSRFRAALGVKDAEYVVGAVGTVDWRKGADLFAQVARATHLRRGQRDVHFVWIGSVTDEARYQLTYDARKLGVDGYVHFVGSREAPDLIAGVSAFDVLCLLSREEPLGMVLLEAACRDKPVLCFSDVGGAVEFVESDCGFVVPYLDSGAMAERIIQLLESTELRARLGTNGRRKVLERYDVDVVAPKIASTIRRFL